MLRWVCALLLIGIATHLWWRSKAPGVSRLESTRANPAISAVPIVAQLPPSRSQLVQIGSDLSAEAKNSAAFDSGLSPVFAAFLEWSTRYLGASPAERPGLIAEGLRRAEERRAVMGELIQTDPRLALGVAVPMVVRQQLPSEIVMRLEERVSGRGELALLGVTPAPGQTVKKPLYRSALIGRKEYRAYVYGRRERQATLTVTSLVGVAVDRHLAVSEWPLRILETGELLGERAFLEMCDISGKSTPVAAETPLNLTSATAVEYDGKVRVLCEPAHVALLEEKLLANEDDNTEVASDNQPGSSGVSGRPAFAWTHGTKKILIIRVDFPDLTGTPIIPWDGTNSNVPLTEVAATNLINGANGVRDFYANSSYGQTTLQIAAPVAGDSSDVTPVLRMPITAASYAQSGNDSLLHSDARAAATALGFVMNNYDRIGVVFSNLSNLPSSQIDYGGLGDIVGKNFWVNGYYDFRIVAHELGHNYGVNHANLWKVTDNNPISATGTSVEYGDIFDVMGSGSTSQHDFSHWNKSILQWIPDSAVTLAASAGTYRVYRFDVAGANLANPRALKIVRDSTRDYWIGYRRGSGNAVLSGSAYVLWGYDSNQAANLLDLSTPGNGVNDAGLPLGVMFSDPVAGITIKPVAQGGAGAEEYLEVEVGFQPRIEWNETEYFADEQGGSAVLTLTRTANFNGIVTVNYATSSGSATAPADYTISSGSVTWAHGDANPKTIVIPIVGDALVEGAENFTVVLSGISGGVIAENSATVIIADGGARDASFDPDFINSSVEKVLPLPDGSVVLGGWFSLIQDEGFNNYNRRGVTRVNASGAVDPTFSSGGGIDTGAVYDLARQPDGKIIAVGSFTAFNGTARGRIVRMFSDGSLDSSFNPGVGANGTVYAVLVQSDGKIVIGGTFTSYNGIAREYIARLNSNGSLDSSFVGPNFGGTSGWRVECLALQSDGLLLVGGIFFLSGAQAKSGLCRLQTTGSLDPTFDGVVEGAHSASNVNSFRVVTSIVVQPNTQILIAGDFTAFNGLANLRGGLARLAANGALDTTFVPTFSSSCDAILLQPDGRIIVGGAFTTFGASTANHLARLSSAGVLDTAFSALGGHSVGVNDLALLPDGRVVFGADFGSFQGSTTSRPLWRLFGGQAGPPGVVQLSASGYSGNEGGVARISVLRMGGSFGALSVGYTTVTGSATANDYTAASGILTWADGDTAPKVITVSLTADALEDLGETFVFNLGQPTRHTSLLGPIQQATVAITSPFGQPPAGFDAAGYLARYPDLASVFGTNLYAAWVYYRDIGIYNGEVYDELFRGEEYLGLYPELYAIFGTNLSGALLHWLNEGRIEGRLGRIPLEFSAAGYFARNPDVAAAVNSNLILGWQHFWAFGIYEGRAYDDEFRVFEYLALNSDLQAAFLSDWRGATLHWMRYGRTEGRLGRLPVIFNSTNYASLYPNVASVWGTAPTTLWQHFWLYGIDEGKVFDNEFRVDEYLALNPDIQALFGTNRRGALIHWVRYGRAEGRPGKNR